MIIPAFTLPTDKSKSITFDVPTVQVCVDFADLSPDMEQEIATRYLDRLNTTYDAAKPETSSLYWTAQDRKAAIFWIYLYVTEDTSTLITYKCGCGDKHHVDFDLQLLGDQVTTGSIEKSEVSTLGEKLEYRITPLFGWAEQHLEEMRLCIDEEATQKQKTEIKVMRVLLQFLPIDMVNKPVPELIERLESLKETMTVMEFERISKETQKYNKRNTFGLPMNVNSVGEMSAITPAFDCTNDDKEVSAANKTRVHMPFRCHDYIAKI